jgi:uncharacterized membrane protein
VEPDRDDLGLAGHEEDLVPRLEEPGAEQLAQTRVAQHAMQRSACRRANDNRVRPSAMPTLILLALAALQIAYYFPRLPAMVASHFDAAGTPNAFAPKSMFLELYVVVLLVLAVISLVLPRVVLTVPPEYINLPNKDYWLAPARREATVEFFCDRFTVFGAGTLALIVAFFQMAITANLTQQPFPSAMAFVTLGAYFAFAMIWLGSMLVRFSRLPS